MKATKLRVVLLVLIGVVFASLCQPEPGRAQMATMQEARTAAENYVKYILSSEGAWGKSPFAQVKSIQEFRRGDRVLGYFCPVDPDGYLILSLYKDLAPVRAYAGGGALDPESDVGTANILKDRLQRLDDALAAKLGRPIDPADDLRPYLDLNFRSAWEVLTSPSFDSGGYRRTRGTRGAGMDYREGDSLLTTTWNQNPPYNNDCPDLGCEWSCDSTAYGCNENAWAGCVAVALAQVIKHWEWPPNRFDWSNMLDKYSWNGTAFQDKTGHIATHAEIDAVADLLYHCAHDVEMDFGCEESGADMLGLEPVIEGDYDYDNGCQYKDRDDYTTREWFDKLKDECNKNRPMAYRIPGHMIVVDGWREDGIGAAYYMVHVVYGWNGDNDGFWSVDAIPGDDHTDDDYIVCQIRPQGSLGETLAGTYIYRPPPWTNYYYFNRDTAGSNATFEAGLDLQVLKSGFLLSNNGTGPTDAITFDSMTDRSTSLYLHGVPGQNVHVRVSNGGAIKVRAGGQMAIY